MVRHTCIWLPPLFKIRIEKVTFFAGAELPVSNATTGVPFLLPEIPHENFNLLVRLCRPKHVDKLARSQSLVHAERKKT